MIRRAEIKDINDILKLLEEVLLVHAKIKPELFKAKGTKYQREELASLIQKQEMDIFVYEKDGKVVAHLFARDDSNRETNILKATKNYYIDDLCVLEKYQRLGIASEMVDFIKSYAKEKGYEIITLNVWAQNSALDFYTACGFSERKRTLEVKL